MDDDFNSAGAIGYLFDLIKTYNVLLDENAESLSRSREGLDTALAVLEMFDQVLGLFRDGLPRAGL